MEINGDLKIVTDTIYNRTTLKQLAGGAWPALGNNFNSYIDVGTYYFEADSTAVNHPHAGLAGWLIVLKTTNSKIKQIWTRYTGAIPGVDMTYMRTGTTIGTETESWSEWVRVPDLSDIYYFAGDTTEIKEWYCGGVCRDSGKTFWFTVPLDKRMVSGVNAKITAGHINVFQGGKSIVNELRLPDAKVKFPYPNSQNIRSGYLTFLLEYPDAVGTPGEACSIMLDDCVLTFY